MATKACDITGIVALACARHGCFVPNTFADMYLGEQQKNIDFTVLRLIKILGLDPAQGLFFIYDIVCQYIINLYKRIGKDLPDDLTIDQAIDLFHVHCHKDECFFRYATTFIPGAGVVAAQILESLWSNLNTISPKLRTASLPHRAEILDDHACDSNNKKMLAMTATLREKYLDSKTMNLKACENYSKMVQGIDPVTLHIWEEEIKRAEKDRVENISAMDLYRARVPLVAEQILAAPESDPAPIRNPVVSAQERWMEFGLLVEETQYVHMNECRIFLDWFLQDSASGYR
jgi:hypothetical protein